MVEGAYGTELRTLKIFCPRLQPTNHFMMAEFISEADRALSASSEASMGESQDASRDRAEQIVCSPGATQVPLVGPAPPVERAMSGAQWQCLLRCLIAAATTITPTTTCLSSPRNRETPRTPSVISPQHSYSLIGGDPLRLLSIFSWIAAIDIFQQ